MRMLRLVLFTRQRGALVSLPLRHALLMMLLAN